MQKNFDTLLDKKGFLQKFSDTANRWTKGEKDFLAELLNKFSKPIEPKQCTHTNINVDYFKETGVATGKCKACGTILATREPTKEECEHKFTTIVKFENDNAVRYCEKCKIGQEVKPIKPELPEILESWYGREHSNETIVRTINEIISYLEEKEEQ